MLQPGGIDAITEFWNWINDGAGSGGVGLHGDFNMTGSYDEWETARRLVERGERKLSDYGGELPGIEPPDEWKRYFDWQSQLSLSEFGSGEWFELAQKMFDFTGDNVFVIGTFGEAPNILLTNNDLRNVPTEFPVSNSWAMSDSVSAAPHLSEAPRGFWICSAPCRSTTSHPHRSLPTTERCLTTSVQSELTSSG